MAVEFGILGNVPSAGTRFLEGQQAAQAEADRNMLRQMQMEQMFAQREERLSAAQERQARQARAAERQKFLNDAAEALARGGEKFDRPTLVKVLDSGVRADEPTLIQFARESLKALDEEDLYQRESTRLGLPGAAAPMAATPSIMRQPAAAAPAAPVNMLAGTPFDIGMGAPAPTNALAAPPAAAPVGFTREQVQQMLMSSSPRVRQQGQALASTLEKPQTYTPSADMQGYELAKSEGFKGTFFDYKRQLAEAGRAPSLPREPSKAVEVVDPATGKTIIVSAEEAIRGRMTPAKAMEGLSPKEIQRREAVFPQAKQSVATVSNTMTEIENTIDRLLNNPDGLNGVTGLIYGITPALTDAARRADADLEQLANLAFVQGITELRAASKTGAGVGNVSNKEGDRFENLKASLKRTQSRDDMVASLRRLKAQATSTKDTVKTEFADMYEYKQARQGAGAAPGAGASYPEPSAAAIDALKKGQGTDAQFDEMFGPGAAKRARSR